MESSQKSKSRKSSRRATFRKLAWCCLTLVLLWLTIDFGYSAIVHRNINRWESNLEFNEAGIREGCEAYSITVKSETAILLVHGINESPHAFSKVAPNLASQGFHCRCMRLPGFGQSMEDYQNSNRHDWSKAIDDEVQKLRNTHKKIIVLAHSLGGAISVDYLLHHAEKVDGLVLVAPAIEVSSSRSPLLPVQFWHSLLNRTLCFTQIMQSPFGMDVLDPSEKQSKLRTPFTPRSIVDETFDLIARNRDRGGEIQIPLLVVLAKQDKVIDNHAATRFFDSTQSKPKNLVWLNNSAHAVLVDYQWQDLCNEVKSFIETLP